MGILGATSAVILGSNAWVSFSIFKYFRDPILSVESLDELKANAKYHIDTVNFNELELELKTGDIILVEGTSDEGGNVVAKWSGGTFFSHVGIIARYGDDLKIFESTAAYGTVFTPMKNRLEYYPTELIAIRRLNKPITAEMEKQLFDFIFEVVGRAHDKHDLKGGLEMFRAALDIHVPFSHRDLVQNTKNLNHLFCSEMVSEAYMRMGLLPNGPSYPPSNEYVPGDFTNYTCWRNYEASLVKHLLDDYELGEEVFLDVLLPESEVTIKEEII